MKETFASQVNRPGGSALPETPHEVPFDRGVIDALVDRVRAGERVNLLEAVLDALDWSSFSTTEGEPLDNAARDELRHYYRQKWVDGGGYVGLGYAVALAELGHQVVGLDIDATRVERLNRGDSPVYELGLPEMLRRNLDEGRLRFTTEYADGVPGSD